MTDYQSLLLLAQRGGYAVGAFNVENMEMAQAVVSAAEAMAAPVILQTTSGTLRYATPEVFAGMIGALAAAAKVPVALHLDHGDSRALAERCVAAGYASVMIDGSALPFDENAELSRGVVEMAAGRVPVEAELGTVGGKEDGHEAAAQYTDPDSAAAFVARTGVSSLAVAIGTAHGVYSGEPKLDIDRLDLLRAAVSVPLVLHGTSGVPEEAVRACVRRGVCKVNYATDLRIAYADAVKRRLREKPEEYDPKSFGKAARDAVFTLVCDRIRLVGAEGRAT